MDFPPTLNGNKISNKYNKPRSLDLIDLRIISMLCKDSNTPFVEIARNIGISDATVHMRVKRLMVEGIIRKFTIALNYDVIGYDHRLLGNKYKTRICRYSYIKTFIVRSCPRNT